MYTHTFGGKEKVLPEDLLELRRLRHSLIIFFMDQKVTIDKKRCYLLSEEFRSLRFVWLIRALRYPNQGHHLNSNQFLRTLLFVTYRPLRRVMLDQQNTF